MNSSKASTVMGVGYLLLVGVIIWFCAKETSTFEDFAKYWGLFATIIGVTTGAIPAFFFKGQAEQAQAQAGAERHRAEIAERQALVLRESLGPEKLQQLQERHQALF